MSVIYDTWEGPVEAVLRREQLCQIFHDQSQPNHQLNLIILSSPQHDVQQPLPTAEKSQNIEESVAKLASGMVLLEGFNHGFELENMLKSSAELPGKGTFGNAYTAVMENGMKIVVKRTGSSEHFRKKYKQMGFMGNARHENLAALRAYYFSKDEQLLLHEHYSNGSVPAMLHCALRSRSCIFIGLYRP